ncbi:hypothetical protein B9Z50_08020 [Limnohabitans sp. Bal53]|nr:hypothetical protein B9Z50_08020 [Limnohabitans sp. Bal53]
MPRTAFKNSLYRVDAVMVASSVVGLDSHEILVVAFEEILDVEVAGDKGAVTELVQTQYGLLCELVGQEDLTCQVQPRSNSFSSSMNVKTFC